MPADFCTYRYDSLDRLMTTLAASSTRQRFYQGAQLITEFNEQQPTSFMCYADQPLAQLGEDARLLGTDAQGSVLQSMRDGATETLTYGTYGQRPVSNMLASRLGFNGELQDDVTGHYLLGNGYRVFNTALMRFNSPDNLSPFGKGGLNAYGYCQGDPINRSDPTAHFISTIGKKLFQLTMKHPKSTSVVAISLIAAHKVPTVMITDSVELARKSLTSGPQHFNTAVSAGRTEIANYGRELRELSPFTWKLEKVNFNLISHGDTTLSLDHAQRYIDIAKQADSGNISNTTAHLKAAKEWMKDTGAPRVVGTAFNLGGALIGSADDAVLYKTGRIIQKVRQG